MDKQRSYNTKQKTVILRALHEAHNGHITAEELAALLRGRGEDVGLATIYRNLEKLVQEGLVLKYTMPGGLSACYQLLKGCGEEPHCCHLVCTACGDVLHLACEEVDALESHLLGLHHFTLDRNKTVLYGRCPQCEGLPAPAHGKHCCH